MRKRLEERLEALKQELEAGREMLAELETRKASLTETLLRIGGAIQVLEEELASDEERAEPGAGDSSVDRPKPEPVRAAGGG